MPSKPRILLAKAADALRLNGPARVFYHLGRPNFGDDLNPWLLGALGSAAFRWGSTRRPHLLGVGSIAARANVDSWVMGSGLLAPLPRGERRECGRVVALRGALTAEMLGARPAHLGDPVCLVDRLVERPPVRPGRLGVVPHAISFEAWRRLLRHRDDIALIDPRGEPLAVIRAIAACERVASQSLHGLVVADAYGIPAVWMEPAPGMVGGRFKFDDYFTAFAAPRLPVPPAELARDAGALPWTVARYLGDKAAYLAALREAAREFVTRSGG